MSRPLSGDQFATVGKLKRVPIDSLKPTQAYVDRDKVARFMKAKDSGSSMPPGLADADGNVQDGHHRIEADHRRGRRFTSVRIVP